MKERLKKLLKSGVNDTTSPGESKYILRSNFINLTAMVLVVVYGIWFYFLGAHFHSYLMIAVFLLFMLVFWMNEIQWTVSARLYQIAMLAACVFYFGGSFGQASSVHFLFFVFVTLPFALFRINQYVPLLLSLSCFIITFYAMEYEWYRFDVVLGAHEQQLMHNSMLTLSLFWIMANYLYYEITARRTEEKLNQYNAQLAAKNKELEQFTYISSHDLQEPLLTIRNYSDLLKKEYDDHLQGDGSRYLGFIWSAAVRMSGLVAGLMEYSRLGRSDKTELCNTNTLLENVLKSLDAQVKATGAIIVSAKLPRIECNKTDISLVFQNLISNALKFRKAGTIPEIKIWAEKTEGFWRFTVQDKGIGIDERFYEKIFIIFQRLHSRKEYEGTGIGLAYCKKVIELHGGSIWVQSVPGDGSTFYFTIPEK